MTKLSEKQAAFVAGKLAGMTHEQAAISAGYAMKSARQQATILMKHPLVASAIRKGKRQVASFTNKRRAHTPSTEEVIKRDVQDNPERKLRDCYDSPLDLFKDVMNNPKFPDGTRIMCAKEALPYCNARVGEKGKKTTQKENAQEVARGRFAPKAAPQVRRH